MHCSKCVGFWGTSYCRLPTHTSLPPCYKILAAPLIVVARCWALSDARHVVATDIIAEPQFSAAAAAAAHGLLNAST